MITGMVTITVIIPFYFWCKKNTSYSRKLENLIIGGIYYEEFYC